MRLEFGWGLREFPPVAADTAADDVRDVVGTSALERDDVVERALPGLQRDGAVGAAVGELRQLLRIDDAACPDPLRLGVVAGGETDEATLLGRLHQDL